jgi:hypothetical protein
MNSLDQQVAWLEANWPQYQIWYVPRAVSPPTWHARRWDGIGDVISADSSGALADAIEAQEG